ncbi:MAG: signal peptidase I [Acidobacteria bacterium]|nr:signal peptidase I [Acidobacteriota bacterium]
MSEKSWSREWLEAILIAVVFALFVRTFVAQAFKIPSGSMEDSLLVGDHLFVNKFIYAPHFDTPLYAVLPYRDVRRGDVVVFRYPNDPRLDYIKRAVAVSGDELEIRAKQLLVNGEAETGAYAVYKDPWTAPADAGLPAAVRARDHFGPERVPADSLFCMGDNRDSSHDSRFWGPVPRSLLRGRASFIFWSYQAAPGVRPWRGFGDALRHAGTVALEIPRKTRWTRTFTLVR